MIVVADTLGYFSNEFEPDKLENFKIHEYAEEYSKKIHELRFGYGTVGLECKNIIHASLVGDEFDYMIFPASVLESQIHREIASNFTGKILLEMYQNIDQRLALDFVHSASVPHYFIGVDKLGRICKKSSSGNTDIGIIIDDNDVGVYDLKNFKFTYVKKYLDRSALNIENNVPINLRLKYLADKI
jgi:phospho-2-dehydro-3-deoxyheptonate aldolase